MSTQAFQGIRNPRAVTFAGYDGREYEAIAEHQQRAA